jgi:hypothetical protein
MRNNYKVVKINKITKEETIIIDNECIQIAKMIARENANEKYETKIINNKTNEEVNKKENKENFDRNYKTNIRVCRNNYIKMY